MADGEQNQYEVVETLETPNPLAYKYILNKPVINQGTKSFGSEKAAESFPFAKAIFSLGDVENLFLKENFVSVTFIPSNNFEILIEAVEQVVEDHLTFYEKSDEEENAGSAILKEMEGVDFNTLSDLEKAEVIDAVLEESIRPALAKDGGGLNVLEVDGNIVRIQYQGACGGCPSSQTGTLRAIQNILGSALKQEFVVIAS
jgi:Fe-S cluster biogenesis protein NfuA